MYTVVGIQESQGQHEPQGIAPPPNIIEFNGLRLSYNSKS